MVILGVFFTIIFAPITAFNSNNIFQNTFSKWLDTIHINQRSFVHWTKITGSKWHNLTSKYYYFKIQLAHYIWIECLFISLQWSNYQLIQLLKMLSNCCITLNAQFLWKMMNNITHLDYESKATEDWVCSGMISFKMPVVEREKKSPQSLYHCYQYVLFRKCIFREW